MALSKVDAVDAETLKSQMAKLKRAAGRTPLKLSAVAGLGVPEVLSQLLATVDARKAEAAQPAMAVAWEP